MTPDEEIQRGHSARRLMSDTIYLESWEAPKAKIIRLLESADLDPAKRERLNNLLVAFATARHYAEQVMQSGKMAAEQIERDRTFSERVKQRFM